MSKKLYPESDIQNIANAIRNLNGSSDTYTVSQMASAIALPENAYYLKESPSANPLSITDGEEFNAQSLKVSMNPIQDLHGYDYPWVGGAGKNKINFPDKTMTSAGVVYLENINPQHAGTYTFSCNADTFQAGSLRYYDADNNEYSATSVSVTATKIVYSIVSSVEFVKLRFYNTAGNFSNFMLEQGNQATDFTPYSNICPISGRTEANVTRTGKNVFDLAKYLTDNSITYTKDGDWFIFSIGSALYANKFTLPELAYYSGQLIIDSSRTVATNVNLRTYKNGNAVTQGQTFANQQIDQVGFNYSTMGQVCCKVQVEYGATITDYSAYQGHTHTSTFGQTVYGGKVDLVSGKLVIDTVIDDLGNYTFAKYTSADDGRFLATTATNPLGVDSADTVCSCYKGALFSEPSGKVNGTIGINTSATSVNGRILICDTSETDATALMTKIEGQKIAYKLATPTEITLTPQEIELLKGQNVLSTNGDNIQLKYWSKSLN